MYKTIKTNLSLVLSTPVLPLLMSRVTWKLFSKKKTNGGNNWSHHARNSLKKDQDIAAASNV